MNKIAHKMCGFFVFLIVISFLLVSFVLAEGSDEVDIFYEVDEIEFPFNLTEHELYKIHFNTTFIEEGPFVYSIGDLGGEFGGLDLCSVPDQTRGVAECEVTHEILTGTTQPAEEEITNYRVRFRVEQEADSGVAAFRTFNFTLIPVNDQAYFTHFNDLSIEDFVEDHDSRLSVNASNNPFEINITGEDEELDYPLNFSIESVNQISGGTGTNLPVEFIENGSTWASLEITATNNYVGNWSINLSVTDVNGTLGGERDPTYFDFVLEVNRTLLPPVIVTNFSEVDLTGKQGENFSLEVEAWGDPNAGLGEQGGNLSFHIDSHEDNPGVCSDLFSWSFDPLMAEYDENTNATNSIIIPELNISHVVCNKVEIYVEDDSEGRSEKVVVEFDIENINDAPIIFDISGNSTVGENISNLSTRLHAPNSYYVVNAIDYDDFTVNASEFGFSHFDINDSRFNINNETGFMNFTFTNDSMVGSHLINVTAYDLAGLMDYKVLEIEILNNTAPILELPDVLYFNQSDNIVVEFNSTDKENDSMYLSFNSVNDRFSDFVYEISLDNVSEYISGEGNVVTWSLDLSEWVDEMLDNYSGLAPDRALYENELVGVHNISVKVFDEFGVHDESNSSGYLSFVIVNENDAPFFTGRSKRNVSAEEIDLGVLSAEELISITVFATDYDLYLPNNLPDYVFNYTESLSFDASWNSSNVDDVDFSKTGLDQAVLSFRPMVNGRHNITLFVNDSMGFSNEINVTFLVVDEAPAPVFESVYPYYDGSWTQEDFISVSDLFDLYDESNLDLSVDPMWVEWYENGTNMSYYKMRFDADISINETITSEEGEQNNSLNVKWFIDGVLKENLTNVDPMVNSSFEHYFDFFSSQDSPYNVTMRASNSLGSLYSEWSWDVHVVNVNRPPVYCENNVERSNLYVSYYFESQDFLSHPGRYQLFYNPDDDPKNTGPDSLDPCHDPDFDPVYDLPGLNFSYYFLNNTCDADFIFDGSTLIVEPYNTGTCEVVFTGTDEYGETAVSNGFWIHIEAVMDDGGHETERVVTVTERITVPVEEEVDVPKPLGIIFPGEAIFYANKTVEVPLVIRNTWEESLEDIQLSAVTDSDSVDEDNVSISFSTNNIASLQEEEEREVMLSLTGYREQGPLKIVVSADVGSPEFTDTETLLIAGMEMASDSPESVRALVTYARDLLTSSPECAELNDLLAEALNSIERGNVDEALRLVDSAINGCQYLLTQEEQFRREQPSNLRLGLDFTSKHWSEIVFASIALIFVAILFYVVAFIKTSLKNK